MNYATWIFLGVFLTFAAAWLGLVFFPHEQLSGLRAQKDADSGQVFPPPYSGEALYGRSVYVREGCWYCHTQQVRGGDYNADLARGWGARRSDPRDYVHDAPHVLGSMRTGPDLANIGARQPSDKWHYLHLYDPQLTSKGSVMPPYRFLFELRKIVGQPSPEALELEGAASPAEGYEVVPSREARALVAYLKSLDRSYEFKE
ncbi:MAG: cbb3-type cytochrome c oxidase subunit II [Planctomycetota bacterium]|nr:cbb3-type cytochrome c oxidase subunit II [Planctomycetota bacterium]